MSEMFFFILLPYAAVSIAVSVTILRWTGRIFSVSTLSSQFLEGNELFYGSVPWHYGIIGVLTGHLVGLLIPNELLLFNSVPIRLWALELTGLALGLLAFAGLVALIVRRFSTSRVRAVTSVVDVILLGLLLVQVGTGVYTAIFSRWGSSWYAISAVPYLYSLFSFSPDTTMIAPLPFVIKWHMVNAFLLIGIFPFSRLVHALVIPIWYLWRPWQRVIWYRERKSLRGAMSGSAPPTLVKGWDGAMRDGEAVREIKAKEEVAHEPIGRES